MKANRNATSAAAAALLLLLAGCSSGGGTTSPSSGGSQAPYAAASDSGAPASSADAIAIKDFVFVAPASVPAGATVTVTNMDSQAHTVTADDGSSFDVTIQGGATATFTAPAKPGSYAFHCTFHRNMHGTLVVK